MPLPLARRPPILPAASFLSMPKDREKVPWPSPSLEPVSRPHPYGYYGYCGFRGIPMLPAHIPKPDAVSGAAKAHAAVFSSSHADTAPLIGGTHPVPASGCRCHRKARPCRSSRRQSSERNPDRKGDETSCLLFASSGHSRADTAPGDAPVSVCNIFGCGWWAFPARSSQ